LGKRTDVWFEPEDADLRNRRHDTRESR
jgi:hypothetical protein